MSYAAMHRGINQYQKVGAYSSAAYADPHRLIQLLFDGLLDRIAQARGAVERGEVSRKGEVIGKAIAILDGLRGALDHDRGGDIAGNLEELYFYVQRRLVEANIGNNVAILDECASLMREIKSAWDAIPAEARSRKAAETLAAREQ